jgi:hypothetical protein
MMDLNLSSSYKGNQTILLNYKTLGVKKDNIICSALVNTVMYLNLIYEFKV